VRDFVGAGDKEPPSKSKKKAAAATPKTEVANKFMGDSKPSKETNPAVLLSELMQGRQHLERTLKEMTTVAAKNKKTIIPFLQKFVGGVGFFRRWNDAAASVPGSEIPTDYPVAGNLNDLLFLSALDNQKTWNMLHDALVD
jgi:hypothetical protein